MSKLTNGLLALTFVAGGFVSAQEVEPTKPEQTEFYKPVPPKVTPGEDGAPPSDAIVLFDGTSLDKWISSIDSTAAKWTLNKDGSMTVNNRTGDIQTKQNFGSVTTKGKGTHI